MSGDLSIDFGSAVPYLVDRVLGLFGKDVLTRAASERLEAQVKTGVRECASVQCVGMTRPVPIELLYQPTRLRLSQEVASTHYCSLDDVLAAQENTVVWGPPGAGKSMFLKRAYIELLNDAHSIPMLFVLRHEHALSDLEQLLHDLREAKKFNSSGRKLVLVVDGYDEVDMETRRKVSSALRAITALLPSYFLMSCRSHYELIDLSGRYLWVDQFSVTDALAYVSALSRVYALRIDAQSLVSELQGSGFADFLASPLLLTLVCILKAGPLPRLPRNTIGLIQRAISTLTFRWDESKGIAREGSFPLDGEERVRCLSKVAFTFSQPEGPEVVALGVVSGHLKLVQRSDIDAYQLLLETAQWYGLFVPVVDGQWAFTHRTIHDYLAAKHWVESGQFAAKQMSFRPGDFTARAAYAACLSPDATEVICASLRHSPDLGFFSECMHNGAPFTSNNVIEAIVERLNDADLKAGMSCSSSSDTIDLEIGSNPLTAVSDRFLLEIVRSCLQRSRRTSYDAALALAFNEAQARHLESMPDPFIAGLMTIRVKIKDSEAREFQRAR